MRTLHATSPPLILFGALVSGPQAHQSFAVSDLLASYPSSLSHFLVESWSSPIFSKILHDPQIMGSRKNEIYPPFFQKILAG